MATAEEEEEELEEEEDVDDEEEEEDEREVDSGEALKEGNDASPSPSVRAQHAQ